MYKQCAGTGLLLRTFIRDSYIALLPWILIPLLLTTTSVAGYERYFPTSTDKLLLESGIRVNPALSLVFGPVDTLTTVAGFTAWRSLALGGFAVALGCILTVIRHARQSEDDGRAELIRSSVVGRSALITAACLLSVIISATSGLVAFGGTFLLGGDLRSTAALCLTFTLTGLIFTGIAALCCQITSEAKHARMIAVLILGLLYLARGSQYALETPHWLLWLNPLAWMNLSQPAGDIQLIPFIVSIGCAALLFVATYALQRNRDTGAGLIPLSSGPAHGRHRSLIALSWILNRSSIIIWTLVAVIQGTAFGYVATSDQELLANDPLISDAAKTGLISSSAITEVFVATMFVVFAHIAAASGIAVVMRLRSEEISGRLELLLIAPVSRYRLWLGYILIALVAPSLFLVITGSLVTFITRYEGTDLAFSSLVAMTWTALIASFLFVSISAFIVAQWPQLRWLAWALLTCSGFIMVLGPTMKASDTVMSLSPLWHVPHFGMGDISYTGTIAIAISSAVLLTTSLWAFRRRDIQH